MPDATHDTLAALRRGDLAGARALRLPAAGLTVFPPEILGLADTLELLDLSGNALTALPDDFGRLTRLQVLFCSGNPFARLPPVLGDCAALSQVGFRGCGLAEVPGEALPPRLRWLTLTDNRIAHLPDALGQRPGLRKLMLSGNRLRTLPETLAGCRSLELIRLASNRLDALPAWLPALPALAWTSWAGNAFEGDAPRSTAPAIPFADLDPGPLLGEGTSGRVHRALWRSGGAPPRAVALKLFKGTMTSDGLPEREMEACLAAGAHDNLTGALGRITGHPDGADGLVMPLLPPGWRVLAGPPSLASCSRDVYDPGLRLAPAALLRLVRGVGAGLAHLHARSLLHGDVYGHNILWDAATGDAALGDFGAASVLPDGPAGAALQRIEVRAFGLLLGEVLDRASADFSDSAGLRDLERACVQADGRARPTMAEVLRVLA